MKSGVGPNPKIAECEGAIQPTELHSCCLHTIIVSNDQRFSVLQTCVKGRLLDADLQIVAGRRSFPIQVTFPSPVTRIRGLNVDEVTIPDWVEREEPGILHFAHAGESIGRVRTVQGGESISVEFADAIGILTASLSACYPCPLVFPHLRLLNGIDIKSKK